MRQSNWWQRQGAKRLRKRRGFAPSISGERLYMEAGIQRGGKEARRATTEEEATGLVDRSQIMADPFEGVEFAGDQARAGVATQPHRRGDRRRDGERGCWIVVTFRGERHDGDAAADDGHHHYRAGLDALVAARLRFTGEKEDVVQNVAASRQRGRVRRPTCRRRFLRRLAGQLQGGPFAHRSSSQGL